MFCRRVPRRQTHGQPAKLPTSQADLRGTRSRSPAPGNISAPSPTPHSCAGKIVHPKLSMPVMYAPPTKRLQCTPVCRIPNPPSSPDVHCTIACNCCPPPPGRHTTWYSTSYDTFSNLASRDHGSFFLIPVRLLRVRSRIGNLIYARARTSTNTCARTRTCAQPAMICISTDTREVSPATRQTQITPL